MTGKKLRPRRGRPKAKLSCAYCKTGIRCRQCGAISLPLPSSLTPRDYTLMLTLIDGSDRKYAPKVLDTVMTVFRLKARSSAKDALQRLRIKLRRMAEKSVEAEVTVSEDDGQLPQDSDQARQEIRWGAMAGEISWDEAMELTAHMGN